MHSLLTKLLQKRGIKDAQDLDASPNPDGTPSELALFENYNAILSKDELTTTDIRAFLEAQVGVIEARWQDLSTDSQKKAELIPYHTVYKTLLKAIDAPREQRQALEEQLINLITHA